MEDGSDALTVCPSRSPHTAESTSNDAIWMPGPHREHGKILRSASHGDNEGALLWTPRLVSHAKTPRRAMVSCPSAAAFCCMTDRFQIREGIQNVYAFANRPGAVHPDRADRARPDLRLQHFDAHVSPVIVARLPESDQGQGQTPQPARNTSHLRSTTFRGSQPNVRVEIAKQRSEQSTRLL